MTGDFNIFARYELMESGIRIIQEIIQMLSLSSSFEILPK